MVFFFVLKDAVHDPINKAPFYALRAILKQFWEKQKRFENTVDNPSGLMIVYTSRQRGAHNSRNTGDADGYLIARQLYDWVSSEKLEKSA